MQGLDKKSHQKMIRAIQYFEENTSLCRVIVPEEHYNDIEKKTGQFREAYKEYNELISDLRNCIESYNELNSYLQKIIYPYVRRMDKELKRRNSSKK